MKNFIDNLIGVFLAILFCAWPAIILLIIVFILNCFGIKDQAFAVLDIIQVIGIILLMTGAGRLFKRRKKK